MQCRNCKAVLIQANTQGEPIIRTRGIVMKANGPVFICPKCKSDVPFSRDLLAAMLPVLVYRPLPGGRH